MKSKKAKLIKLEIVTVVIRGLGRDMQLGRCINTETCNQSINKSWRYSVQHSDY